MPAPAPQPTRFSPERLVKAEQQAAESYRLIKLDASAASRQREPQRMFPPLPLRYRRLHPAYKARLEYRQGASTSGYVAESKPQAQATVLTESLLAASDAIMDGSGDHTNQHHMRESTAGSFMTAVTSGITTFQGDRTYIADCGLGESYGKASYCEGCEYFTSQTGAQAHVAPAALVNSRAAACIRDPPLSATETSPASQQKVLSTADQVGQACDTPPVRLINTLNHANIRSTQHSHPDLYLLSSITEDLENMSTPAKKSQHIVGLTYADVATGTFATTPNPKSPSSISAWKMTSQVEETQGLLRAASDGKIVEEQTGDIVHLDTPDDEAQQYYAEVDKHATTRRYAIPEMKNGATAIDDPRARKPIARILKNWWSGSSRPPSDKPHWIFQVGDKKPTKLLLHEMIKTRRHEGGANVRYSMIKILKRFWNPELTQEFGHGWVTKADEHDNVVKEMEDFVLGLVEDKPEV